MNFKLPIRPSKPRGSEKSKKFRIKEDDDFNFGQFVSDDDDFSFGEKRPQLPKLDFSDIELPRIDLSKLELPKNASPKKLLYALFAAVIALTLAVAIIPSMVEDYLAEKEAAAKRNDPIAKLPSVESLVPAVADYTYNYHRYDSSTLFAYDGPVEYLTIGPIIADTREAFDKDEYEQGLDNIALTAKEFRAILQNLYDRGYILVDINDLWVETTSADGSFKMVKSDMRLPKDKKPVVLFFESTNFTSWMDKNGFPKKLVVGTDGELWTNDTDSADKIDMSQEGNGITILDSFIEENPMFSLNGAKGCIVLTGNEGIFGYATAKPAKLNAETELYRRRETANLISVIQRLKETGWYFGCNTYSNLNLSAVDSAEVIADVTKWVEEVGLLVGRTKIFLAPGDSQLDGDQLNRTGDAFNYLHSLGFRIFISSGIASTSRSKTDISAACCTSMRVDGSALKWSSALFVNLFDINQVFDFAVRPDYGRNFGAGGVVIGPEPGANTQTGIAPEPGATTQTQ